MIKYIEFTHKNRVIRAERLGRCLFAVCLGFNKPTKDVIVFGTTRRDIIAAIKYQLSLG